VVAQPDRYLWRMVFFVLLVVVVTALLIGPLLEAFNANAALNGLILATLLFGIGYAFRQVTMLRPEIDWLLAFQRDDGGITVQRSPTLLAPMATMLAEKSGGRMTLSALSTRSILDSISSRLDESRDLSRYLIGLLIFLGLLGTFWGLLKTVAAVGATIGGLSLGDGDFATVFDSLKSGLQAPLTGMSVAFSSSLFGLAGSLVLGFLELQASQAQNRFFNELEEWLSGFTRLGSGGTGIEGDHSMPAYVQALLEQTADSLENLQRTIARTEDGRASGQIALNSLAEHLAGLTDQMRSEQSLVNKVVEDRAELQPILSRLAAATENQNTGLDEASRSHLRNIDVYLQRLLEEVSSGRDQTISEIRSEIKLLARTIAALADDNG
jgi:hypothetical protein